MNKLLTKIVGVVLGTTMAVGVGVGVAVNNNRDVVDSQVFASQPATAITDASSIVSGSSYYIGSSTTNGDYYFSVADTVATGVAGVGQTSKSDGTVFVFTKSGDNWTIQFASNSNYLCLSSNDANGKVNVQAASSTWTIVTTNNLLKFTNNGHVLQKNTNNNTTFGSYKTSSNQKNLWLEPASSKVSVTYDGNGNTGGSVPTDGTQYDSGSSVTIKGNTGSLTKTGYTWSGWSLYADGHGTVYGPTYTTSYTVAANTKFYARWVQTLDAITSIDGSVTASVSDAGTTKWDFSNVTVAGTISGVTGQNVKSYVDLSSTTTIPSTAQETYTVSVTATKKEGVEGSALPFTNNSIDGSVAVAKLTYSVTFSYTDMWSNNDKAAGKVGDISYATETSHPKTSTATCAGHESIEIQWASNNVYNPGSGAGTSMQFRANSTPKGYIYNTSEFPGTITGVTYNSPSSNVFTTYYGDSEHPTSSTTVGGKFFTIVTTASGGTNTMVSATITFEVSDKNRVHLSASNMNLDVSSGATTPTITDDDTNPVSGYNLATNDQYIASITNDKKVQPTGYGVATITVSKPEDFSNIYISTSFTVTVGDSSKQVSSKTFTEKAGSSVTASDGTVWTIEAGQSENDFDEAYGINYGTTSNKITSLEFTTPAAQDGRIIKNVVIECMSALSGSTVAVSVGESNFTCSKSTSLDVSMATYNFSGSASGAITITISGTASTKYGVKSIAVLYVGDEAIDFASTFLGAISCDSNGINKPSFTIKTGETYWTWALLKAEFDALSPTDQAKFAPSVEGDENGTTIERAIARYDYIVGKYYTGNVDRTLISSDFMNRNPSVPGGTNRVNAQSINSNNSTVTTVVIISVISLSTLCGYFLLRKRKEER